MQRQFTTAFGCNAAPSYRRVARWTSTFPQGREDVNDHSRSTIPGNR